MASINSLWF